MYLWKLTKRWFKLEYNVQVGPLRRSAYANKSWDHCILKAGGITVCYDATWEEKTAFINRGRVPYRKETPCSLNS